MKGKAWVFSRRFYFIILWLKPDAFARDMDVAHDYFSLS